MCRGPAQRRGLVLQDPAIVHPLRGEVLPQVGPLQITLIHQDAEIDEQGVAGKGRIAHVRGVAPGGGAKRQHLPERLAGFAQEIDEPAGILSQRPDTARTWK